MTSASDISRFLRSSVLFQSAPEEMIRHLATFVASVHMSAGEKLFGKGDLGTSMYFVVEGRVRIHDGDLVLNHLGEGEVFGEIGALAEQVRTASVTAEIDSTLLQLDQETLYATLLAHPAGAKSIIQGFCHRQAALIHDVTERTYQVKVFEHDMEIARRIQQGFLPGAIPDVPGWQMQAHLQPAREVAGDFYDLFVIPSPSCFGVVVGDVCDKGVGAALFMTLFRSLIRSTALFRNEVPEGDASTQITTILRNCIVRTNQYIATTHGHSSMFSSVFIGLLVPDTGQLYFINAGHESPMIIGTSGVRQRLDPTGPVVGLFPEAEFSIMTTHMLPGEFLVAYTDGVTDAKNPRGEQFSEARILASVCQDHPSAKEMFESLTGEVERFTGKADQFDDTTLVVVQRALDRLP